MPDKTTAVCAARTNALVCNIHELIAELEERIEDGEPFDNPKLTRTAERVFGGTRAQGKYTPRDAYDAVEIAVNNHLFRETRARTHADGRDRSACFCLASIDETITATKRPHVRANRATAILDTADTGLPRRATLESKAERHCFRAISRNGQPRDLASLNWRTSYLQRDKLAPKCLA